MMTYNLYVIIVEEEDSIGMELKVFESKEKAQEYIDTTYSYIENQSIFIEKVEKVDDFQVFVKYSGGLQ